MSKQETLEFRATANTQGMGERQGRKMRARYPTSFLNHMGLKDGDELIITVRGKTIEGLRIAHGNGKAKKKAAPKAAKQESAKKSPLPKPSAKKKASARKTKVRFTTPAE